MNKKCVLTLNPFILLPVKGLRTPLFFIIMLYNIYFVDGWVVFLNQQTVTYRLCKSLDLQDSPLSVNSAQ